MIFPKLDAAFRKMDEVFADFEDGIEEAFVVAEKMTAGGVCITNNNGHIVITGRVKSLRINDQVVEIKDL